MSGSSCSSPSWSLMRLYCAMSLLVPSATGRLVLPSSPPRGWNSFDLQWDSRTNPAVPTWNETLFRSTAHALSQQLLPFGYDTITIDGGWSDDVDEFGRPIPNKIMWPSTAESGGFHALADLAHSLGLKFGVWTLRGADTKAVQRKTPVKNAPGDNNVTIDQVVFDQETCPNSTEARWCKCTWDPIGIGPCLTN